MTNNGLNASRNKSCSPFIVILLLLIFQKENHQKLQLFVLNLRSTHKYSKLLIPKPKL